jgi:hypothetical protein
MLLILKQKVQASSESTTYGYSYLMNAAKKKRQEI